MAINLNQIKGVVSLTGAGPPNAGVLANRPDIDGITLQLPWYTYEPTQGVFVPAFFDEQLPNIAQAGKFAVIGIGTGRGRQSLGGNKPDWLMDLVGANTFTYLEGDGAENIIPWFWEPTFIAQKILFIQDLGQRYANNPALKVITIGIANAQTEDWAMPDRNIIDGVDPPGSSQESRWITAGYTHALMVAAAGQLIDAAMTAFPNQFVYAAVGPVQSLLMEPDGPWALSQEVISNARLTWGDRFLPARNNLTAKNLAPAILTDNPPWAAQALWYVAGDAGFRMNGNSNPEGLTEDQILRNVFDVVSGAGATFFEIYQRDALNLPAADAYGHSLLNPSSGPGGGGTVINTAVGEIRAINFREVIWGVAHQMGWITSCDPEDGGPSDDQFCELVSFCNAWVRRMWDSEDWPEWTRILKMLPDGHHFVANPGRTLRMYHVDPDITPQPLDVPFSLYDARVHCGFDHGVSVWLKYMPLAPEFTDEKWDRDATYKKGKIIYSPVTGECYKGLIARNRGHDPARDELVGNFVLDVEYTQKFRPEILPEPATDEVWIIQVDEPPWFDQGFVRYQIDMIDEIGGQHRIQYDTPAPGGTVAELLDALEALFLASVDPFINSLVFAQDLPNSKFSLTRTVETFGVNGYVDNTVGPPDRVALLREHPSRYNPGHAGVDGIPQLTLFTLESQLDLVSATYSLQAKDSDNQQHQVQYQSAEDEPLQHVLQGIVDAILAASITDAWWGTLVIDPDPNTLSLSFLNQETVQYEAQAQVIVEPEEVQSWELVRFPWVLAEPVMRGMYANALKEEGQTDKGAVEEQAVQPELAMASGKSVNQQYDRLTDQQQPRSRYRM